MYFSEISDKNIFCSTYDYFVLQVFEVWATKKAINSIEQFFLASTESEYINKKDIRYFRINLIVHFFHKGVIFDTVGLKLIHQEDNLDCTMKKFLQLCTCATNTTTHFARAKLSYTFYNYVNYIHKKIQLIMYLCPSKICI